MDVGILIEKARQMARYTDSDHSYALHRIPDKETKTFYLYEKIKYWP